MGKFGLASRPATLNVLVFVAASASCGHADEGVFTPPPNIVQPETDGGTSDGLCGPCGRTCSALEVCAADACVPRSWAPPRLIAPLSLSKATSQQPLFRWLLPNGYREARFELCADRACERVVVSMRVLGDRARPASPLAQGVYFWRVTTGQPGELGTKTSATWELRVRPRDAGVDTVLGDMADIDGDGYADVITRVGTPPQTAVLAGGPGGTTNVSPVPVPRLPDGTMPLINVVGDINGDGFADRFTNEVVGNTSRRVLRGGSRREDAWMRVNLAVPAGAPGGMRSAGDIDGDGYGDVLTQDSGSSATPNQVRVYFGSADGLLPNPRVILESDPRDPTSLVWGSRGDVNGDGLTDFVFGKPSANDGAGRAAVWVNANHCGDGTVVELPGDTGASAHFGEAVSLTHDFNGDGYADAAVTAPFDARTLDRSAVWIFPGSASGPVTTAPQQVRFAGRQTETIRLIGGADLNGDGFSDLAVWMHTDLRPTSITLLYGSAAGLPSTESTVLLGPEFGPNEIGFSAGYADDVDRDGFDDLLVMLSPGRVVLSRGTPQGPTLGVLPSLAVP